MSKENDNLSEYIKFNRKIDKLKKKIRNKSFCH